MLSILNRLIKGDLSNINLPLLSLAGLLVPTLVFIILILNKGDNNINASLGQYGDFFGGFSNPLLTFLTFLGVLYTVYLQREALNVTKNEANKAEENLRAQSLAIAKQSFEATVFQMINLHNSMISSLVGKDGNYNPVAGKAALNELMKQLSRYYANNSINKGDSYISFYNSNRDTLGHYFRMLFNIVKFIDEKCPVAADGDELAEKMTYVRILRAQMSDSELVLMFYNITVGHGELFQSYIKKFDMLDNLDGGMLFDDNDRDLLQEIRPN